MRLVSCARLILTMTVDKFHAQEYLYASNTPPPPSHHTTTLPPPYTRKTESEFFRARSLSVYDQMREASMLLLAQQKLLAAEEAREESSKPRFVARAGSQAARAQAIRDRVNKKRAAAEGLPLGPMAKAASSAVESQGRGAGGVTVVVPAAPGMLSGSTLGVGGLDEELEEIRRRVRAYCDPSPGCH